jgi:hypothetical protein
MGSLDDAAEDNTTQEVTLATIRTVSGDWDNNNVSTVPNVSAFTSSGTFIAPAGCSRVEAHAWGGGGSGARQSDNVAAGRYGGSGGSGGYCLALISLSATGAHIHVTIGSGGASQSSENNDGNSGGNTTLGLGTTTDNYSANGGNGGGRSSSYATAMQGNGGEAHGGILNIQGGGGTGAAYRGTPVGNDAVGGTGGGQPGMAPFIGSTPVVAFPAPAIANTAHGGQPGMYGNSGSESSASGAGGSGLVLIKW